ncbi:DUF3683 domain-containing protein [Desulfoluna butyratoxydans]|uniref:Alpha-helical ferredoxin n=1 Tax=Desulfoluna butyratoxydans TaxID=231438 RepID=A0A4U8YQ44_9BACT|nr:DUF3683 domain-containing protein [Desulfoluna butyratoxydans]VFQ45557.1 alpha-helical ferredoxin [Desulfoluna butyratoxydans]
MKAQNYREIPYNYTSADDELVVTYLFDAKVWNKLQELRGKRITGRSAKLLMRLMGDLFILKRNPFLFDDLAGSRSRRRLFLKTAANDLAIIEKMAEQKEVLEITGRCRKALKGLNDTLKGHRRQRRRIRRELGAIIGRHNVCFEPFSIISHATDATDWRRHLAVAVLRPTRESQVPRLVKAIERLGLSIIPRGAGTGLTGGSVPVTEGCVMINTEKLNRIRGIKHLPAAPGTGASTMPVLELEAGVITQTAMGYAEVENLVFATDPTSSWACTIGGNIAENAGGKKAVMWGTAIDNLVSYRIAMPGGRLMEVRREDHPMRKILPEDTVLFSVRDEEGQIKKTVSLSGTEIRKIGLGKDITNKALGGLPGIQKEGCDGIITSAEFILYPSFEYKTTFCLEFFGNDMEEASDVIVKISKEFDNGGKEALIALEHFDDEYMLAINYKVKATRKGSPKAVLLIDMVGHNEEEIDRGTRRLQDLLGPYKNTEIFVARDEDEAERFWKDRKKLGAIARRTNAFKLNEDIVLPLDVLGAFTRFVDTYNLEENRYNQLDFLNATLAYLEHAEPIEDPEWLEARIPKAREICSEALSAIRNATTEMLQDGAQAKQLLSELLEFFRGYKRITGDIQRIFNEVRARQIIIATHMHAGDGNVHVNIPVFSNDMEMMKRAAKTADDVMEEAVRLGGVVSGEHGIGITKMKYLDPSLAKALAAYRKKVDPKGVMNPGQLTDPDIQSKVYTPSFNLLELEASILQHGSLETLAAKIATCVRCGKCKIDCCTFYPAKNMFYHPRNKNLAIASLIEAILYDVQRAHSTRFKFLKQLEQIADHCTMCHKCFKPCPVDIDTAEVSLMEREILVSRKYKKTRMATRASLAYLETRNPLGNALFRKGLVSWGGSLQRTGHQMLKNMAPMRKVLSGTHAAEILASPVPRPPAGTLRDILPKCGNNQAMILNPPEETEQSVFYFPGCGSERLFSDISKAAIYILLSAGVRVVLPPPYICCGFPAKVNAKGVQHSQMTLRDSVIFSQIREMISYVEFDACVVSCGTCREALEEIEAPEILDCDIADVSRFALENGLEVKGGNSCLYHAPCHDSLDGDAAGMLEEFTGYSVDSVPHCCSEGGTLSMSRPDITNAMLQRKHDEIELRTLGKGRETTILTNCPSCIQGLGRNKDLDIVPRHLAVELAIQAGGKDWEEKLKAMVKQAEVVTF